MHSVLKPLFSGRSWNATDNKKSRVQLFGLASRVPTLITWGESANNVGQVKQIGFNASTDQRHRWIWFVERLQSTKLSSVHDRVHLAPMIKYHHTNGRCNH